MSNGKGDGPRPASVSPSTFAANYERTFGERIDKMFERFPPPIVRADDLIVLANPPEGEPDDRNDRDRPE